jgi:methyltransferase OMS1
LIPGNQLELYRSGETDAQSLVAADCPQQEQGGLLQPFHLSPKQNMAANLARNGPLVAAGAGIYTAACIFAYNAISSNKADVDETASKLQDGYYSFVEDPRRTERFQAVAECYDKQIGRDESVMGINLLRRSLLYFHAKGVVLEVGAGTGRNIGYYPASSVERVLMTDASDEMLAKAKKKLPAYSQGNPQYACVEADGQSLAFPNQYFDTVVDTFGLCSYDDPVKTLKEMARVCKPDGRILLLEHGRSKTWYFISQYLDKHAERHAKNWGCVWNRDLDSIIGQSGLELESLHTWHFGTTYYVVCRPK